MAINLPRYADDDAVDLVNGAYSQAMDAIEKNLTKASTDSAAAKTKADQAYTSAEQAKTSVLEQKSEIDKLRGDVDGLIAGGGEATVPIATTTKAGIVKPDGATISVGVDGGISLADHSVNTDKLTAAAVNTVNMGNGQVTTEKLADFAVNSMKLATGVVTEEKLSEDVKTKLNNPTGSKYVLPVATTETLGGVKAGGDFNINSEGFIGLKSNSIVTVNIRNENVTEAKLSADVQAKLNKPTGLTKVPDNSVTTAKIADAAVTGVKIANGSVTTGNIALGTVTENRLSRDVQAKLNKSTGLTEVPDNSVTSAKIVNGAVTETKLSAEVQAKLNKPAGEPYTLPIATKTVLGGVKLGPQFLSTDDGAIALGNESIYTSSYVDNSVTEAKLSTDVQNKLNRAAPAYSLPVASTSRLGGVKAGRDIDIDSSGLMTIGSGMIEESQLSSSVQNKLNKSSETISAQSININTTSYAGANCHGFKFGDLVILNIQARNLSGNSGIKIGSVAYAYTPRNEMSGPCVCGNGLGQFVIRTSGDIIINPKGYGADGFFTCTYVL